MYEKISKLIVELFKDCKELFSDGVNGYDFKKFMRAKDLGYSTGATKGCFFLEEFPDYAIKVPFMRYGCDKFKKANSILPKDFQENYLDWNYCAIEEFIYKEAERQEVNELLCETIYFLNVYDYPIYIQKKVPFIFSNVRRNLIGDREKILSLNKSLFENGIIPDEVRCVSYTWLNDCLNYYGEDFYKKAIKFIAKYCDDLHGGNIGYMNNGQPVIFDYSSYSES